MVAYWLWTSQEVGSHFTDFKQVKNLVVIFLTPSKSKNVVIILLTLNKSKNLVLIFDDFEQVEKFVLLTLDKLSCFSDGCFSDGCFLDNFYYLLLLLFIIFTISKKYNAKVVV